MFASRNSRPAFRAFVASVGLLSAITGAQAAINGFGDFSGFSYNHTDSATPPAISPGKIDLTGTTGREVRTLFYSTPQNVSSFTASFTYQLLNHRDTYAGNDGFGASFVLENAAAGPNAIGDANAMGTYGLSGIGNSAAVTLESYDNFGVNGSNSGYYTNGNVTGGSPSTAPVFPLSGDPINVVISFDGSKLTESMVDSVTLASYRTTILANPLTAVGGTTAYVGFAAVTNGNAYGDQYFSNFAFGPLSVPEPSSAAFAATAAGLLGLRRRR